MRLLGEITCVLSVPARSSQQSLPERNHYSQSLKLRSGPGVGDSVVGPECALPLPVAPRRFVRLEFSADEASVSHQPTVWLLSKPEVSPSSARIVIAAN